MTVEELDDLIYRFTALIEAVDDYDFLEKWIKEQVLKLDLPQTIIYINRLEYYQDLHSEGYYEQDEDN